MIFELAAALTGVMALWASSTGGLNLLNQILLEVLLIVMTAARGYWRRQARQWHQLYRQTRDQDRPRVVAGVVLPPDDHTLS